MNVRNLFALVASLVLPLAAADLDYDHFSSTNGSSLVTSPRPQSELSWETYLFKALDEHRLGKRYWSFLTTLKNNERNDVPGKIVNHYKGTWLLDEMGKETLYFDRDEIWLHYYSRSFPGIELVFRDRGNDGFVHQSSDKVTQLDGIGTWDRAGYHPLSFKYFLDTGDYEFQLADGRWGRANVDWYRRVFSEVIRCSLDNTGKWISFKEARAGEGHRSFARDVGFDPRKGYDERGAVPDHP